MRTTLLAASFAALLAGQAGAETIGVSMQSFDDNFQTLLRNGITARAAELEGVDVQFEDSQRDVGRQLSQVENFIALGVGAIVVTLADTSAAPAITSAAESAGVPLVYLNLEPANVAGLPDDQAYVGSRETEAGMLGGSAACKLLAQKGKRDGGARTYIIMGDLSHNAALERTQSMRDALGADGCKFVEIAGAQQAGWLRTAAADLMTNWMTTGEPFDAVFANNDEMAIGATQAMRSAGVDMEDVVVVGVDVTQDGLAAMRAGDLDVTVFQNAAGQAAAAVDAAVALSRGGPWSRPSTSRSSWSRPRTWTPTRRGTEAGRARRRARLGAPPTVSARSPGARTGVALFPRSPAPALTAAPPPCLRLSAQLGGQAPWPCWRSRGRGAGG